MGQTPNGPEPDYKYTLNLIGQGFPFSSSCKNVFVTVASATMVLKFVSSLFLFFDNGFFSISLLFVPLLIQNYIFLFLFFFYNLETQIKWLDNYKRNVHFKRKKYQLLSPLKYSNKLACLNAYLSMVECLICEFV